MGLRAWGVYRLRVLDEQGFGFLGPSRHPKTPNPQTKIRNGALMLNLLETQNHIAALRIIMIIPTVIHMMIASSPFNYGPKS